MLADGTILKGHQRVRALIRIGKTVCDVLIRYDLVGADDVVIEREFLEDNQHRRQLTPLAKARVAVRLLEIKDGKSQGSLLRRPNEETRDRVGKVIGMSGRNLSRYLLVLAAPREIQRAFEANQLSLVTAGKVALLSSKVQQQIAKRIGEGESAKHVVAAYLPQPVARHVKPRDALNAFVKGLCRGVNDLAERVDEIPAQAVVAKAKDLREARKLIRALLDLHKQAIGPEPQ